MKDVCKLNEILKHSISINNRNVVAAICAQELMLLKAKMLNGDTQLNSMINKCLRDIYSKIPMRLCKIEDVIRNKKPMDIKADSTFGRYVVYYGIRGKNLNKTYSNGNLVELKNISADEDEYFVYMYPATLPELQIIQLDDSFNVIQAFNLSEELCTNDGVTTRMKVYTAANPGAFTNAKLKFK